jgi:hypothetical protein
VCWEPSLDHDVVIEASGQPVVTEYALEVYLGAAAAPFWTLSLGKPPVVAGAMRVPVPTIPGAQMFRTHVVRVAAVGPTGTGRSDPSNPFYLGRSPVGPVRVVVIP